MTADPRPAASPSEESGALAPWFRVGHPRYRRALAMLFVLVALAGAAQYVENWALGRVSEARGGDVVAVGLAIFAGALLVKVVARVLRQWIGGRMSESGRADLEREVLLHLLRKDEGALARLPRGEILGRLGKDIGRVVDRRETIAHWSAALCLMSANLVYFAGRGWPLLTAALGMSAVAVALMRRQARRVRDLDREYLSKDDAVKARLEDLLQAAPEIQAQRLEGRAARAFGRTQDARLGVGLALRRMDATVDVVHDAAYVVSVAALAVIVFRVLEDVALLPLVVKMLVEVFRYATDLVRQGLALEQASSSAQRLLEYESPAIVARSSPAAASVAAPSPARRGPLPPLRLEAAAFEHDSAGGPRGVRDVSAVFVPGRLTVILGGPGCGKTTLANLLAGRLRPQRGSASLGERTLDDVPAAERASLVTLLPAGAPVLDASIGENLSFGLDVRDPPWRPTAEDLTLLEALDLGDVLRARVLDERPGVLGLGGPTARRLADLRAAFAARRGAVAASLLPFGGDSPPPRHWVLESALGGVCDRPRALAALLSTRGTRACRALAATPTGARLAALGRAVLDRSASLLRLARYDEYARLSRWPVAESIWRLRTASARSAGGGAGTDLDLATAVLVGLTATAEEAASPALCDADRAALEGLRPLLGDAFRSLDGSLHPFLTWRENVVSAAVVARNRSVERAVDAAILSAVAEAGLSAEWATLGLDAPAGRGGASLTISDARTVVLARALLRRTPIAVLDEPTAAMDAERSARVARTLRAYAEDRILVTATADPAIARLADDVLLLEDGRVVAFGPPSDVGRSSPAFAALLGANP